jgi:hypothetical protein
MASSKRRLTSSIVPRQNSLPATVTYLVALFLDPHDLTSFAIVAHQTNDDLRQFPLDLIEHGRKYTQRQLSASFIQPGYWKPTTVMSDAPFMGRQPITVPTPVPSEGGNLPVPLPGHSERPDISGGSRYLPKISTPPSGPVRICFRAVGIESDKGHAERPSLADPSIAGPSTDH